MKNLAVLLISILWSTAATSSNSGDIDEGSKTNSSPLLKIIRHYRVNSRNKSSQPAQWTNLRSSVNFQKERSLIFNKERPDLYEQTQQELIDQHANDFSSVLHNGANALNLKSISHRTWVPWMAENYGIKKSATANNDGFSGHAMHLISRHKRDTVFEGGTSLWAVLGGLGGLLLLCAIACCCWWSRSCGVQKGPDGEVPPASVTGARIFLAGHGYENMAFDYSRSEENQPG